MVDNDNVNITGEVYKSHKTKWVDFQMFSKCAYLMTLEKGKKKVEPHAVANFIKKYPKMFSKIKGVSLQFQGAQRRKNHYNESAPAISCSVIICNNILYVLTGLYAKLKLSNYPVFEVE